MTDISPKEFQNIAKSVPGIIYQFCIDDKGQQFFTYVSPVIHRLLGLEPQRVIEDAMLWINQIHSEDIDNFNVTVSESLNSMEPWNWEGRMIHIDGPIGWYRGESIPSKKDNIVVWSGIVTDITRQHKVEEKLKALVATDHLTTLYNKRYFTETSTQIMLLAQRNSTPLSIMMLDIDQFKNINDTYGHIVGDLVIVECADKLLDLSRKSDILCRFGGDEFITILPETQVEGTFVIAEKIRKSIENIVIEVNNELITFTVSIGVSQLMPDDTIVEELIQRADHALYHAKNLGRNQVCLFQKSLLT